MSLPSPKPTADVFYYYEKNWSLRILLGRNHPRLTRFFLILSAWFSFAFAFSLKSDALFIEGNDVGFLEDLVMLSLLFVLPAIVIQCLNVIQRLENLFAHLPDIVTSNSTESSNNNITPEIRRIREFVSLRTTRSRQWYFSLLGGIFVLVYFFQIHIPLFTEQKTAAWALAPYRFPELFIFACFWSLFYWGMIIGNAIWMASAISFCVFPLLHRYVRSKQVVVLPVAPDGRGGLAPIGALSFSLTLLISIGLIVVVFWLVLFGVQGREIFGLSMYFALLISAFFLPLLSVHRAMRDARENELQKWASLFRSTYSAIDWNLTKSDAPNTSTNPEKLEQELHYLNQIERLYARAEAMPVWPFDLSTLRQFMAIIVLPLLLFVVQLVTENALRDVIIGLF